MNTRTPASAVLRATPAGTRRSLAWRLVLPVPLALEDGVLHAPAELDDA